MSNENLVIAKLIEVDVKRAIETPNDKNLKNALESVKRIFNTDGSYNHEVIRYLRSKDMKLVWAKSETETSSDQRLGLCYKGSAFGIVVLIKNKRIVPLLGGFEWVNQVSITYYSYEC